MALVNDPITHRRYGADVTLAQTRHLREGVTSSQAVTQVFFEGSEFFLHASMSSYFAMIF